MQKKGANISLKGYDDIFSTDQSRAEAQQERVQEIPLSELHPFEGHPFRVVDDEEMMKTAESVRDFGVLTPAIVRPDPDGGYEIVSGHRRHRASELAGKETMPAIVRDLDDDAAIILMVDANLQRESILPSERAFAYKMKLDAIKHQGQRTDLTSSQVGMKLQAMDIVGQEAGESRNQVHRYIRLTELIPELLDMVDTGQIKFNPAVELSYLASEEQKDFLSAMDYAQAAPSLSQAQRIKKLAQEGECTLDAMCEIMIGNPGRGKTHLSIALGLKACTQGYNVLFKNAATLSTELCGTKDNYRLGKLERTLAKADLLILDELSYLSFNRHQSELLFKVISDRSEKSSTIVTTNLPFSKWTDLFENTTMVAALIDRLTFRSHILDMNGDSYRLRSTLQDRL